MRFKDYWAYKDLKALYKKVVPAVKGFEKNIFVVNKDMGKTCRTALFNLIIEQTKEIIRRFDEVLLTKASKISFEELQNRLADYTQKIEHLEFVEKEAAFHENTNTSFKNINESLIDLSNKLDIEIKLAVKRATSYLLNEIKKTSDKGYVNKDTVLDMMWDKVDKIELLTLLEHKSNKNDVESGLKAVDIMHKQIKNIVVILLELLTQFLEPDTSKIKLYWSNFNAFSIAQNK